MSSSIRIVDMPDLGVVTDNSSVVGEHAGSGRFSAPALSAYFVGPTTVNAKSFGATGNGTTNDTAAINAAIASGKAVYLPAGTYLVTNALNITTMGQRVYGDGPGHTFIRAPATFTMTARGVFSVEANAGDTQTSITEPGPTIEELTIEFDQVDTNVKAGLIQFPPAIYITNTLRWHVRRVRVMRGWDGIYAYGNLAALHNSVGGGYVDDFQSGCLNTNIYIDGSTDTLRINNAHLWPFGLTSNQQQIFLDPAQTVGIVINRADDFHISNGLCLVGLGIRLTKAANGGNYGTISNIDFDTYSGIEVISSNVTLSSCLFLVGANRVGLALLGDAHVTGASLSFSVQSPGASAVLCWPPAGTTATLVMSGFSMGLAATNLNPAVNINSNASPGASDVSLSNGQFQVDPTIGRGNAVILCQSNSATLVVSGCQIDPRAAGAPSAVFVQITGTGTNHRLTGNSAPGWPNIIPAGCVSDYPSLYQQLGGAADLDTAPVPWTGFGFRNYISAGSATHWPPHSAPHIALLDTYTANTAWGVQLSFGYSSDGIWYRWAPGGTPWNPWYQIVTTYGGMRMHGNLDFDNATGVRLFDTAGTATVSLLLSAANTLIFNGINAAGGARNIATMAQRSDTAPFQFSADVQFLSKIGFHSAAPIAIPNVTGAWAGNTAGKALCVALASYGLISDSTSA